MTAPHLPLISTIAVGLSLAFILGFCCSKLKVSPVLGYLLAGIIVGPHTPGFVASLEISHELSEIGIVLLMFGVGLHFSLKDLMEVKNIALTGAVLRILFITAISYGLASLWGWSTNGAIIYGLALSVASTVVLLRSFEQHNLQHGIEGRIAIGWLVVEDLIMILALVLVPVLAQADAAQDAQEVTNAVAIAIGKVLLFGLVMGVAGRKLFPILLHEVNRTGSRELFTLSVLVSAIGVAYGAAQFFDVSLALGSFFAGMVINSSQLNHEVAARALPFQDAFAVLFFVAIGMLFDPIILLHHPFGVLATSFIIIGLKFAITFAIVASFSYALKRALVISAGLAQIGEFSFILIGMGLTLGILPTEGRDVVLAGAFISIALNPMLFRATDKILAYIKEHPQLARFFTLQDQHTPAVVETGKTKHILLIGYGRLGEQVIQNTKNPKLDFVVIDTNKERVNSLLNRGIKAILGDASNPDVLKQADVENAVAAVFAITDPYQTRCTVEAMRALRPDIKTLVRTSNDDAEAYFEEQNIDLVLLGRKQIGQSMVEYLNKLKP